MHYVVDRTRGFTVHEGDYTSCLNYISNVRGIFASQNDMAIASGAKDRDRMIKESN